MKISKNAMYAQIVLSNNKQGLRSSDVDIFVMRDAKAKSRIYSLREAVVV
jgi:hypothetical protein